MAVTGLHALMYSADPAADRAFLRDVLGWPFVSTGEPPEGGGDWLIFKTPPTELGVHPVMADQPEAVEAGAFPTTTLHLMCDDVAATVADLRGKGVEFVTEPSDYGYGIGCELRLPGGSLLGLYEPRHPTALHL